MLWNHLFDWFNTFSPNLDFLSDVIAYQAAIIAIAIPVSLEIISRISERYQSGIITQEFNRQRSVKILLPLAIADALLAMMLKFLINEEAEVESYWNIIAWIIFILFIATNILLFAFFNNLRKYATQTQFLLNRLFDDITQILGRISRKSKINNKKIKKQQEQFINTLEGIGDILVFETKNRKNNQFIITGLRQIQDRSQKFLKLQESQPERFLTFSYSDELLQFNETDRSLSSAQIASFPEKYLVALMAVVNQFLRLREAALEVPNLEIARLATYNLIWLLEDLSQNKNQTQAIETLLRILADLRYASRESEDDLAYTLAFSWYTNVVFIDLFKPEYLELFNRYFVFCIHETIASGKTKLFERLVQALYDSIHVKSFAFIPITSFKNFLYLYYHKDYFQIKQKDKLTQNFKQIENFEEQGLQNQEHLNECFKLLDEIQDIIYFHFKKSDHEKIQKQLERKRSDFRSRFKFNNLINLMFDVSAYCIFKERYDYLYELWTFRQPDDADAMWTGHDLVPTSLPGLFNLHFRIPEPILRQYWEKHHGKQKYYNQYFLILLLREFVKPKVTTNEARQSLINNFQLPDDLESDRLNDIKYEVDGLIPVASQLHSISESLKKLGFDEQELNDAIEHGLMPFLESLKPKVDRRLEQQMRSQKISERKVEEFKSEFLKGYEDEASLKKLFRFLNLYENQTYGSEDISIPQFKFEHIGKKTMFFEKWYVDYGGIGKDLANDFINSEHSELIVKIARACKVIENTDLDEILAKYQQILENLIIVAVNTEFFNPLDNSNRFKPKRNDRYLRGCLKSRELRQSSQHEANHSNSNHSFRSGW